MFITRVLRRIIIIGLILVPISVWAGSNLKYFPKEVQKYVSCAGEQWKEYIDSIDHQVEFYQCTNLPNGKTYKIANRNCYYKNIGGGSQQLICPPPLFTLCLRTTSADIITSYIYLLALVEGKDETDDYPDIKVQDFLADMTRDGGECLKSSGLCKDFQDNLLKHSDSYLTDTTVCPKSPSKTKTTPKKVIKDKANKTQK